MKNIKKLVATLGLLGIIIMTASSAQAGIVLAGRSAAPTPIERVFNSVRNVVIGQLTGVSIQSEGILVAGRDGIVVAGRTPVYITD